MATTFSRTGTAYCRKSAFPESNGTVSFKEMTISLGADSMKISLSKPISLTKRCVLLEKPELLSEQSLVVPYRLIGLAALSVLSAITFCTLRWMATSMAWDD